MADASTTDDDLRARYLAALRDLRSTTAANRERADLIVRRADALERRIAAGTPLRDALLDEPEPRIVELLTENLASISAEGAAFRSVEALVLHDAGSTMVEIAELFGVTRQRVSALLRQERTA